jgi:hypothetical protein
MWAVCKNKKPFVKPIDLLKGFEVDGGFEPPYTVLQTVA